jgi:hypothetical protein
MIRRIIIDDEHNEGAKVRNVVEKHYHSIQAFDSDGGRKTLDTEKIITQS